MAARAEMVKHFFIALQKAGKDYIGGKTWGRFYNKIHILCPAEILTFLPAVNSNKMYYSVTFIEP